MQSSVVDILDRGLRHFSSDNQHQFLKRVMQIMPQLKEVSPDVASETCVSLALELLPDHPEAAKMDIFPQELPKANFGQPEASILQMAQLTRFFALASTKVPKEAFQSRVQDLFKWIPYTDGIYDKNFKFIFSEVLSWVIENRSDIKSPQERKLPIKRFPVKDLIKRRPTSEETLKTLLVQEPVKQMPDIRLMGREFPKAEFVDLDKVVGGWYIKSWSTIEKLGGGIKQIYKFVQGFSTETIDLMASNEPVKVVELNGEYFISEDGTHRTAALKALGVPFVPMLVTHIRNQI